MPVTTGGRFAVVGAAGGPVGAALGRKLPGHSPGKLREGRHVRQSRGGDGRHLRAQRRHVALAVGMQPAREKDDVGLGRRIDPDRRAGEAGVPERSNRQQLATIGRKARIEVPPEAAKVALAGRRRRRHHPRDGERCQHVCVPRRIAEEHPAEAREIVSRREQTGVAGHPAHAPGRRIVHGPAQERHVWTRARVTVRRALLGWRDPRLERIARAEHRVAHPQRLEDAGSRELVEAHAAHLRHEMAEHEEVDVAVDEAFFGSCERHLFDRELDRAVVADPVKGEVDVRAQAGGVRQQMADRDVLLAVPLEAGDVRRDAIVQPDAAFLHQQHDAGRGRHHFGERGCVEDGVERHRLAHGLDRACAERLLVEHPVALADEHDGSRELAFLDRLLDHAGQPGPRRRIGRLRACADPQRTYERASGKRPARVPSRARSAGHTRWIILRPSERGWR